MDEGEFETLALIPLVQFGGGGPPSLGQDSTQIAESNSSNGATTLWWDIGSSFDALSTFSTIGMLVYAQKYRKGLPSLRPLPQELPW
jgi:hypothetical protein